MNGLKQLFELEEFFEPETQKIHNAISSRGSVAVVCRLREQISIKNSSSKSSLANSRAHLPAALIGLIDTEACEIRTLSLRGKATVYTIGWTNRCDHKNVHANRLKWYQTIYFSLSNRMSGSIMWVGL